MFMCVVSRGWLLILNSRDVNNVYVRGQSRVVADTELTGRK